MFEEPKNLTTRESNNPPQILEESKVLLIPRLRQLIDQLSGPIKDVLLYHFGFIDENLNEVASYKGKFIRPALVLASFHAFEQSINEPVLNAMAAIELVHNFSLIHDDLMDEDEIRRHRKTTWKMFGKPLALLAGDALLNCAFSIAPRVSPAATQTLAKATQLMIEGQVMDIAFERSFDVSVEKCISMASMKTGALLGASCQLGVVASAKGFINADVFFEFGNLIGVAFQAVDDLIGIWGDTNKTGKPVFSDLRQNKRSIPICYALSQAGEEREKLRLILTKDTTLLAEAELTRAAQLIETLGGRKVTFEISTSNLRSALELLEQINIDPIGTKELSELASYIVFREL